MPVHLRSGTASYEAAVVDASRTGACVRIPAKCLGLAGAPTLLAVARRLSEVLPEPPEAHFDPARLGPLVFRLVDIVRVGLGPGAEATVELGCSFDRPLTEVEAAALGVAVPPVGEGAEEARDLPRAVWPPPEAPAPEEAVGPPPSAVNLRAGFPTAGSRSGGGEALPRADTPMSVIAQAPASRPSRRYEVHLKAPERRATPPLLALTDRIDRDGIVLLVLEGTVRGVVATMADSQQATLAFCEAYGHRVELRIQDGGRHLWTGAVQLRAVEIVPASSGSLLLDFRYVQPLTPAELRNLGLDV